MRGVPKTSGPEQGMLPFVDLDNELSALHDEVSRLRAENARLLRLLELTPSSASLGPCLRWSGRGAMGA